MIFILFNYIKSSRFLQEGIVNLSIFFYQTKVSDSSFHRIQILSNAAFCRRFLSRAFLVMELYWQFLSFVIDF